MMSQDNEDKLNLTGLNVAQCFELPKQLSDSEIVGRAITSEELDDLVCLLNELCPGEVTIEGLRRHTDGTYTHKDTLLESLFFIYVSFKEGMAIRPITDETNTILSSVVYRLSEGIHNCTPGFHDRVNWARLSLKAYEVSIIDLLYQYRVSLVEEGFRQNSKDVHAHNSFFRVANSLGLGVLPVSLNDIHLGTVNDDDIKKTLYKMFSRYYGPLGILTYINDNIKTMLSEKYDYYGRSDEGYEQYIFEGWLSFIKTLLEDKEDDHDLLYLDEETGNVLDLNWRQLSSKILAFLVEKEIVEDQVESVEQLIVELLQGYVDEFLKIQNRSPFERYIEQNKKDIQTRFDQILCLIENDSQVIAGKHHSFFEGLLLLSVVVGHQALALILIKKGVALDKKCIDGSTALILAVESVHKEIALALIENGAALDEKKSYGSTALILAVKRGHKEITLALIENGAALDVKDNNGNAALIWALRYGHKEIAFALIEKGAAFDEKNNYGSTALIWAVRDGYKKVALILIEKGVALGKTDYYGNTALVWSIRKGDKEIALALIEKGAALDKKDDNDRNTALIWAVQKGYQEIVLALIKKRAALDVKDRYGQTALVWAIRKGHKEIALALIENGAALDEKDICGNTALIWAVDKGHKEIALALIEHGASLDEKNRDGDTVESLVAPSIRDEVYEAIDKRLEKERAKKMRRSSSITFFEPINERNDLDADEIEMGEGVVTMEI
jgi:ankyrin repeat protein